MQDTVPASNPGLVEKVTFILKNPITCWPRLKAESTTVGDVFAGYVLPLAAIPAITSFIRFAVLGITIPFIGTWRAPFFGSLVRAVISYGMSVLGVWVAAEVFRRVAPKFGGKDDKLQATKLVAYSMTAGCVGAVFNLFPLLWIVAAAMGFYGLYTLFQGVGVMLDVPQERRMPVAGISMLVVAVIFLVISSITSPRYPESPFNGNSDFNKAIEQLQKLGGQN